MDPTVEAPAGDLCAGVPHLLTAVGCDGAATVEWVVVSMPGAVSGDEIVFSSPQALETTVIVPIAGAYSFAVKCCEIV